MAIHDPPKFEKLTTPYPTLTDQDACGEGANCRPLNHRAECTCPDNFIGSPQSRDEIQ